MDRMIQLMEAHPRFRRGEQWHAYAYGTAGFRDTAEVLDAVLVRLGCLAALYSRSKGGAAVGVMITASHNLAVDNGAKVMDHRGEMLEPEWEAFAQDLANCPEGEPMRLLLQQFIAKHDIPNFTSAAAVAIAMDTRPSSQHLYDLCAEGVQAAGGQNVPLGLLTTPQLHWIVREHNANPQHCRIGHGKAKYEEHMQQHFSACMGSASSSVYVDCANGVGAVGLSTFASRLQPHLVIHAFNTDVSTPSDLNKECGAEFVQKTRKLPQDIPLRGPDMRYASMDGDADRLVYYYCDDTSLRLLDGDKIMCLLALYLKEQITDDALQFGVVQTAYANGASTQYLKEHLQLNPICVPTGVKHLHHKAAQFDIGLYFEANGHGTVLFSTKAMKSLEKSNSALYSFAMLSNQGVGDAIADMLLIEVVLAKKQWSLRDWDAMYADFPSVQSKVTVKDRTQVKTADAERKVVSPQGLQQEIDTAMSTVKQGRAFVRPSGTEDCVRIYAEAATMADANCLAQHVQSLVQQYLA